MSPRDPSYILDILEACRLISEFLKDKDRQHFWDDLMLQSAVMRQLEIIGEAAKRLSDDFKKSRAEIAWKKVAGLRDILIHAYDHVDLDEVWNIVRLSLPDLVACLEKAKKNFDKNSE